MQGDTAHFWERVQLSILLLLFGEWNWIVDGPPAFT